MRNPLKSPNKSDKTISFTTFSEMVRLLNGYAEMDFCRSQFISSFDGYRWSIKLPENPFDWRKVPFGHESLSSGTGGAGRLRIYGAVVQLHGRGSLTFAQTDVTVAGGTPASPQYIYAEGTWAAGTGTVSVTPVRPVSDASYYRKALYSCGEAGGSVTIYQYLLWEPDIFTFA